MDWISDAFWWFQHQLDLLTAIGFAVTIVAGAIYGIVAMFRD